MLSASKDKFHVLKSSPFWHKMKCIIHFKQKSIARRVGLKARSTGLSVAALDLTLPRHLAILCPFSPLLPFKV